LRDKPIKLQKECKSMLYTVVRSDQISYLLDLNMISSNADWQPQP